MKLTKGMKKALSLLLSAAMVVTGVNVTAGKASAEETAATPSKYVLEISTPKKGDGHDGKTIISVSSDIPPAYHSVQMVHGSSWYPRHAHM